MLFNSYVFLLFFLPVCLIGYYSLNHFKKYKIAQLFLLGMSLWFYAYFNLSYLAIIVVSILFNFGIYKKLEKEEKHRKLFLIIGLLANILAFIYFKYMDFFISNINSIFNTDIPLLKIVLPLGISFFTFQQLSFVIDSYKKEVPKYDLLNYASFVAFFPQLIAGPIVTHDELVPQFLDKKKKKFNWDNFAPGLYAFTLGLAKKVLIADTFGAAVNYGFGVESIETLTATNAIIVMLSYTIQIYFDFSGYSDMAIGLGKMFNIDLPVNFNSPYKALTIKEFWDRWHMTLTRFFTKYVYIPLGGSRKGNIRTYVNVFIVFLVSGFWHGANWTFILWGIMHGVFSIIYRIFKDKFDKLHPAFNWLITFTFVNLTWLFFRADSIGQAWKFIKTIFSFKFGGINSNILKAFKLPEFSFLLKYIKIEKAFPYFILQLFFIIALVLILHSKNVHEKMEDFKPSLWKAVITVFLLLWCIISFAGVSTFLYFNF